MDASGEERVGRRRPVRIAYLASLVFHCVLLGLVVALLRPAPQPPRAEAEPLGFETWSAPAGTQPSAEAAGADTVGKGGRPPVAPRRAAGQPRPEPARVAETAPLPTQAELLLPEAAPLPAQVPEESVVVPGRLPGRDDASSSGVVGPASGGPGPAGSVVRSAAGSKPAGSPGAPSTEVAGSVGTRMLLEHPDPDCVDDMEPASVHEVQARICVAATGAVSNVTVVRAPSETVSGCVSRKVRSSWRYRPLTVDGRPVPFCYLAVFRFE